VRSVDSVGIRWNSLPSRTTSRVRRSMNHTRVSSVLMRVMSVTYRIPGAVLIEREHSVPLVHADASRGTISVFTRELAAPDGLDRPYLVFLQGGPGFEAARPTSPPSGWMKRALADFRVLLLDQRGTGRSTPVGPVIPGATPVDQAEYLTHFRADAIVRDLELIRAEPLESARSELRWLHLAHLSVAGARGAAGGTDHRWPCADHQSAGRRCLCGDMGSRARSESALSRQIPGRHRSFARDPAPA
jgi:hypothetical protein